MAQNSHRRRQARTPAEIGSLARGYCAHAIEVVRGIMDEKDTAPNIKIQAATILMDRGLGKPAQAIAIKGDPDSPVIFNLRLGDGMINGGQARLEPMPGGLTAPLVTITVDDDTSVPDE